MQGFNLTEQLGTLGSVGVGALMGGIAAELSGGDFGVGAISGAWVTLFNHLKDRCFHLSIEPRNAEEFFRELMKMKEGQIFEGKEVSDDYRLQFLSITKDENGFHIKLSKSGQMFVKLTGQSYDPNNRFTLSNYIMHDGTAVIKMTIYEQNTVTTHFINNDAYKFYDKPNQPSFPYNFRGYHQIGDGKW